MITVPSGTVIWYSVGAATRIVIWYSEGAGVLGLVVLGAAVLGVGGTGVLGKGDREGTGVRTGVPFTGVRGSVPGAAPGDTEIL